MNRLLVASAVGTLLTLLSGTSYASTTYVVKPGDSLWKISIKYHTQVETIEKANHLKTVSLQVGQRLYIPSASSSTGASFSAATSTHSSSNTASTTTYTVSSGDTLWGLSNRFGESVQTLMNTNHLSSDILHIGQHLVVNQSSGPQKDTSEPATSRGASFADVVKATSSDSRGAEAVAEAKRFIGSPYAWGGSSPQGFDCSGFVRYVMNHFGIDLPRSTYDQVNRGTVVSRGQLVAGDLVFFDTGDGISHVGIYTGSGQFVHADSSRGVLESSINDPYYWSNRYVTARRVL